MVVHSVATGVTMAVVRSMHLVISLVCVKRPCSAAVAAAAAASKPCDWMRALHTCLLVTQQPAVLCWHCIFVNLPPVLQSAGLGSQP